MTSSDAISDAISEVTSGARVLAAIFAHPDDETFSMGGTLARYASEGVACHLLCATDGDAGSSSDVSVSSQAELGRVRREELRQAAEILGVRSVRCLGHPDGGLPRMDADLLVGEVVACLREWRPQVVVTFGPEGAPNSHRDHRVISHAATAAFFLAGLATAYPEQVARGLLPHVADRLYYVSWEPPGELEAGGGSRPLAVPLTARMEMAGWKETKRQAFAAHRTQQQHVAHFEPEAALDAEAFALATGRPQPAYLVSDLFDGL